MRCIECSRQIVSPSLVAAMEQSKHFALTRNCEACDYCAEKSYAVIERHRPHTRDHINTMECTYCNKGNPIMRLRYDIIKGTNTRTHVQFALCEPCYGTIRDEILRVSPELVGFLEKEWNTGVAQKGKRLPWPPMSPVIVKAHVCKFHDMKGRVLSFRGLVQPWYGYEVQFDSGGHHFFHERDLSLLHKDEEAGSNSERPLAQHSGTDKDVGASQ